MGFFDGLAGGLLGGILDFTGQQQEIAMSKKMQKRAHDFTAQQNALGRDFAREQMNTAMDYNTAQRASAYQTAVGDLKKAGLNPMLAYTQGGASNTPMQGTGSPHGGGTTASVPRLGYGAAFVSSAQGMADVKTKLAQANVLDADAARVEMDTRLKAQQIDTSLASAGQLEASRKLMEKQVSRVESEIEQLASQTTKNYSEASRLNIEYTVSQARELLLKAETFLTLKKGGVAEAQQALLQAQAMLTKHAEVRAGQEAKAHSGWLGKVSPYLGVMRGLGDVGRTFNNLVR